MKKRLFALVLLLLLLAGCTAAPEADYMAPVRAYCLALQNNDFSQLQQAMPAAVLSSNGLDAGELDELTLPTVVYRANSRWYVEFSRQAAAIKK